MDHIYGIGLNMYNLYAECETTKFTPGLVSYSDLTYLFPSIKNIQKQKSVRTGIYLFFLFFRGISFFEIWYY